MATRNRDAKDCYGHSSFIPSWGMTWATQITVNLLLPAPGRFPDTTVRAPGLGARQPRRQMGLRGTATWSLGRESIFHRNPTTEGFLPVFPPELSVIIFQLEIKKTIFLRPSNARRVAVDFLGTTQTQAYNWYPRLVKCLCEPNEEESYIYQGSLRGNLHVYLFLFELTYLHTIGSQQGLEKSCDPL